MKKINLFSVLSLLTLLSSMSACSQDKEGEEPSSLKSVQLKIAPVISSVVQTRGEKNSWSEEDSLGIFLCQADGDILSPYLGKPSYSNVLYTFDGSLWNSSHEVNLGVDMASVYAYYPYCEQADPTAIPIDLESQTDYLYGKADTLVNYLQKVASIRMRHAMTEFVLQLQLGEYDGEGYVTDIQLVNGEDKSHIVSGGTLNIRTGQIQKGEPDSLTLYTADSVSIKESKLTVARILVPTGETELQGDIRLEITIDGKVFYYDFKAGTDWKAGYRNIYRSAINSNELVIDPENGIIIEPWIDKGDNPEIELVPVS